MNDLVRADAPLTIEAAAEKYIVQFKHVIDNVEKIVNDDPVRAVKMAMGVDIAKIIATKTKVTETSIWAAKTRLYLCRQLGEFIMVRVERGRPGAGVKTYSLETLNVTRNQSSNWQKMAKLPKYAWEYALKLQEVPSENSVVREYGRFIKLKNIVSISTKVHDKAETLKKCVVEGITPQMAEIMYLGKKDADDVDVAQDESDDEVGDVTSPDSMKIDAFAEAAEGLDTVAQEIINFLDDSKKIDKELFNRGVTALNKMRKTVVRMSKAFSEARRKAK